MTTQLQFLKKEDELTDKTLILAQYVSRNVSIRQANTQIPFDIQDNSN